MHGMPEGHTLHRLAREHRAALAGAPVVVSSPQGRFAAGAARLDGAVLDDVESHGKHLFYRWDNGELLHVHLGLVGTFTTHASTAPPPSPAARLRMAGERVTIDLAGAMIVELVDPAHAEAVRSRLGPDPLRRRRGDRGRFGDNLRRRAAPIGAVLLDQSAVAGIGNVYRAEALFATGIHPDRPARSLDDDEVSALWGTLSSLLRAGVRDGRIVTVAPADVGVRSRARIPDAERVYVYRRGGAACRRCDAPLRAWTLAGRTITACEACQAPRA
jgi:endonuclease-8